MKKIWSVTVYESERGWGRKDLEIRYFAKKILAEKFWHEIVDGNVYDHTPDYYISAELPKEIEVPDAIDIIED